MTDTSPARRIAEAADETVSGWMALSADDRAALADTLVAPSPIHPLKSGGYLVDMGEAFPFWRADMGAVRRLLRERDLIDADLVRLRTPEPATT
jgi:hypothetical protein